MFRNAKCYCERTVKSVDSLALYDLQKTNKFTDRTLQSGDGAIFQVHTIVMMSLCPDFKDLMPREMEHNLPYSSKVISTIVELAYTGATTTDEDLLEEQLKMAKHFGIDLLTKIRSDFIIASLTMGN